ncbi:TetR/AcrR family transcriptional regulator [Acetobacter sicerae]|uniref:TetR/AcrR family transcriptional regulator n=1 Tax=Acetobacter sicerae TaxID=85325 RepID=UPI00156B43B7|nr:TetR/AcrR family transcriptional regulator [Acetobacter sicerae]NHN93385.1 TetR family transcriptional regulator [Acetobacter sicerae]
MTRAPKRTNRPEAVKTDLLDAAARILTERGILAFTLDLVARDAGVSKGGLLHHFANKKTLLDGLFLREMEAFRDDILASMQKDPEPNGRAARAYIGMDHMGNREKGTPALLRHLLAVMLLEPQLCSEWTRHYWETIRSTGLFDNMTPSLLLSCLAADGLAIWDILGADIIDKKNREQLHALIEKLTNSSNTES